MWIFLNFLDKRIVSETICFRAVCMLGLVFCLLEVGRCLCVCVCLLYLFVVFVCYFVLRCFDVVVASIVREGINSMYVEEKDDNTGTPKRSRRKDKETCRD